MFQLVGLGDVCRGLRIDSKFCFLLVTLLPNLNKYSIKEVPNNFID